MLLNTLSKDEVRRRSSEEKRGRGAEWLSAALGNHVLPAQHLRDVKHITPAKHFVVAALLPHFLSAFKSLLQTARALGLLEENAIIFLSTQPLVSSGMANLFHQKFSLGQPPGM